jgi:hypothetical protein
MRSLRSLEGYMLIDHSMSPGISDEVAVAAGLPAGVGRLKFESATFTCSHCEVIVVLNPDRSRARGYCSRCDHYICDSCTYKKEVLGEPCYPFKAQAYDAINKAIQESTYTEALPSPIILP